MIEQEGEIEMSFSRASGILLHPTSLPGRFGVGDLGAAADEFIDFLEETGQSLWQVLPLGPTGYGDSPYQCFSAFAGNPLLIDLESLVEDGLLDQNDIDNAPEFPRDRVDYGPVIEFKSALLKKAHANFIHNGSDQVKDEYLAFIGQSGWWLEDYAIYRAIKDAHGGREWTKWDQYLRDREDKAMHFFRETTRSKSARRNFISTCFSSSGSGLRVTQTSAASGSSATRRFSSRTTAPMFGRIAISSTWMTKAIRRRSRACRRIISAKPANCGAIRFTDGM